MYKIIGADKKEYGPVTAEQVREWIAQGRANAESLLQTEGSAEWKPLSVFPEFAANLAGARPAPFIEGTADPQRWSEEILARDYTLDIGSCLSRAWALLQSDFWPIIGVSALILIILAATNAAYVGLILTGPLLGGLFHYYFKKMRQEHAELADAFSGFTICFLQLFLGSLVSSLLITVGLGLCVLPGIYLAVAWQFVLPLIMDKRMEFWPAMELSRKVVSKHWWTFLGFAIVLGLVNFLGVLVCGIGLFVTAPLTMIALAYAYEDIFRAPIAPAAHPV